MANLPLNACVSFDASLLVPLGFGLAACTSFALVLYPLAARKPLTPYLTIAGGVYAAAVAALFAITNGGF